MKKISVIPPLFQAYDYVMFAAMMITRILLTIYPYNGENGLTLAKAFWRAHFPSPYLWAFGHKYGLQMVIQTCRIQQWAWQILAYRFNYITFTLQARYFSPTEKDFLTNLLFGATVFIFEGFLVFVFFKPTNFQIPQENWLQIKVCPISLGHFKKPSCGGQY